MAQEQGELGREPGREPGREQGLELGREQGRDRYNSTRDAEISGLNLVRDILAGSLRAVYGHAETKDFLEGWKEFHPGPLPEIIIGD
jgi:hypothetical protein